MLETYPVVVGGSSPTDPHDVRDGLYRTVWIVVRRRAFARRRYIDDVAGCNVSKCHARADGATTSGIRTREDRMHVAAAGVETRDWPIVLVEHACPAVGHESAERAHVTWPQGDGVEGSTFDRTETRIRPDRGIPLPAVVGGIAFAEVEVLSRARELVVPADGLLETARIDAEFFVASSRTVFARTR